MKNPSKIPGLKIWLDAADTSTINNGTIQNGQNVFKIVDKSSGYVFRNGYGVNGPSYSVGVVNGKNAITVNYYTVSDVNSIQAKGLWAGNVTPMASGTYSLYCVAFPYDNRQRNTNGAGVNATQDLWVFSLINNIPASIVSPSAYVPHRGFFFRSRIGGAGQPLPNLPARYYEDVDFIFQVSTILIDSYISSIPPAINNGLTQSDSRYIYGKTNVIGVRASNNLKKFSIIRKDYIINENFQPNPTPNPGQTFRPTTTQQGFTPAPNGPWLTIGAIVPNAISRSVEGVAGPMGSDIVLNNTNPATTNCYPFEGHFCEFLFWDRVLTDPEANSVESYLKKKWT
jgi:hypothetical protein